MCNYLLFHVYYGKKKRGKYRPGCQNCVKIPKKSHFNTIGFILLKVILIILKNYGFAWYASLIRRWRSIMEQWNGGILGPFAFHPVARFQYIKEYPRRYCFLAVG